MKRILVMILAFFVLGSILCAPGAAFLDVQEESAVIESTQNFLQNYIEKAMLYEDTDTFAYTAASVSIPASVSDEEPRFALSSGDESLTDIMDNISFVSEKAEYFSEIRQLQNITRTNFETTYHVEELSITGETAFVKISQVASFYYPQYTEQAIYETIYDVDLIKINDEWLIADITDNDWFDVEYKGKGTLDVPAMIAEEASAIERNEQSVIEGENEEELRTYAQYHFPYNRENAAAYAFNHTRQNTTDSRDVYYNKYFSRYDGGGGDCMNFASQCVYAGFSGTLDRNVIDSHAIPMDNDGTYQWYGSSSIKKGTGSNSWTSCQNFRKYLTGDFSGDGTTGSNADTDIGIKAMTVYVPEGAGFSSGVTKEQLVGAVAHVKNNNGPHAHAIVLTDASGLNRNQIRFCAHTTDKKYVLLADDYNCAMRVYIPQYFRANVPLTSHLQVNMIRPFAVGNTKTVSFFSTGQWASMRIEITLPVSGTTRTIATTSNSKTCSTSYKFMEKGYYRVDCYAKRTSSSAEECVTFQILVV